MYFKFAMRFIMLSHLGHQKVVTHYLQRTDTLFLYIHLEKLQDNADPSHMKRSFTTADRAIVISSNSSNYIVKS